MTTPTPPQPATDGPCFSDIADDLLSIIKKNATVPDPAKLKQYITAYLERAELADAATIAELREQIKEARLIISAIASSDVGDDTAKTYLNEFNADAWCYLSWWLSDIVHAQAEEGFSRRLPLGVVDSLKEITKATRNAAASDAGTDVEPGKGES